MDRNEFRLAVRSFYDYQDIRISMGNRLKIKKDGESQIIPDNQKDNWDIKEKDMIFFNEQYQMSMDIETNFIKWLKKELKSHPVYTNFLEGIKGCGPLMSAIIISEYDIFKADTVSKMWSYTGLAPIMVHGKKFKEQTKEEKINKVPKEIIITDTMVRADRLTSGFISPFNTWLRTKMIGVLAGSFLKCNSPYRKYYDNIKNRYSNEDGWKEKTLKHRHNAAMRYMIKMFIKDLYVAWRNIENLPIRIPYEEEYLGIKHNE